MDGTMETAWRAAGRPADRRPPREKTPGENERTQREGKGAKKEDPKFKVAITIHITNTVHVSHPLRLRWRLTKVPRRTEDPKLQSARVPSQQ